MMMEDLLKIYPQLEGLKARIAWAGLMGYSVHKMPHIGQMEEGIWYCTNFGGNGAIHGGLTAIATGKNPIADAALIISG